MKLIYKLLLAKSNPLQLIGFMLANVIGVAIILFGVRAFRDVESFFNHPDGVISNSYVVITHGVVKVGADGDERKNFFSEAEIAELMSFPGTDTVGRFRTCSFKVNADLGDLGIPVTTAMFIESVPDSFLDLDPSIQWGAEVYPDNAPRVIWDPKQVFPSRAERNRYFVPVILPRAYITVYNFGFASSRGLDQYDESHVMTQTFKLRCRSIDETVSHYYTARIVGFSDRFNSILVPDSFLKAAVEKYGGGAGEGVTNRLIIKPRSSDPEEVLRFIESKGYHYDGTAADTMKAVSMVEKIAVAVMTPGVIIFLLAFFLLVVSLHLLIEKNKEKNATLIALGYTKAQVCRPYVVTAVVLNFVSLVCALLVTCFVYGKLEGLLLRYNPSFVGTGMGFLFALSAGLFLVSSLLHAVMVYSEVREKI